MRHLKDRRKLNMTGSHRTAMFRNMLTSLLMYERINTTVTRAKELKRIADKMITKGKKDTLASRRRAFRDIRNKDVLTKLFTVLGVRYKDRNGGYTRIYKSGIRAGDAAPMAIIELVDRDVDAMPKRRVKYDVKDEAETAPAPAKAKVAAK